MTASLSLNVMQCGSNLRFWLNCEEHWVFGAREIPMAVLNSSSSRAAWEWQNAVAVLAYEARNHESRCWACDLPEWAF